MKERVASILSAYETKIRVLSTNVEELQQENKILKRKLY